MDGVDIEYHMKFDILLNKETIIRENYDICLIYIVLIL